MGTWGPALYSNDTTSDVRDSYIGLLQDQLSNEEAYEKTIEYCQEIIQSDEEALFWFALAETQWRVGRLRLDVKAKALEWIEKDGGLELWEDNLKGGASWLKTLQKLKEKLESPIPKEKRFPKIDLNPWNLHDVYAYQLHGEDAEKSGLSGKYILLQKIGEKDHGSPRRPKLRMQLHAIDHVFDDLPELEDINRYRILPMENASWKSPVRPLSMNGHIYSERPSEYPKKYLTFLGNRPGPVNNHFAYEYFGWQKMDWRLCHHYELWQGKEYKMVEEGIYQNI